MPASSDPTPIPSPTDHPGAPGRVPPPWTVGVRALCEFSAKTGDLDLRFTPSPTAQEGMEGHQLLGARRPPPYETELSLQGQHGPLQVRGRADGFDPVALRVDEFKTHRGDLSRQPANHRALHWAQAHTYGHLLCETRGLPALSVALVYLELASGRETVFTEHHTAASLRQRFDALCQRMLHWAAQEATHRRARDAALQALVFPHPDFRTGQRELAEAVYRAAVHGRCLLAQAPTGIGKTVGTLFPLLKAVPGQGVDKVFFLTAKTPGRQLALDGLRTLAQSHQQRSGQPLPLRVLELVARDTACEHPDKACHGDACPLARGFYDRLPAARQAAVAQGANGRAALRQVALAHELCPYYLSQELARWADVVVGDYNHYFDLHALLHGLTQAHGWRVALLVDEAHNLVPRGRLMATASLELADLRALRHSAVPALRRPLDRVYRAWSSWQKVALAQSAIATDAMQSGANEALLALDQPPEALLAAVQRCVGELTELSVNDPLLLGPEGTQWLFEMLHFLTVAERFDHRFMADITVRRATPGRLRTRQSTCISLRNVVPAAVLQARWATAHTATLFSATLAPPDFHRNMLGLPEATPWVDVASPFQAAQLQVQVAGHISTRFAQRAASVAPIVTLMARQWQARPGNYLAFFSSFDYLAAVAAAFAQQCPDVPLRCQTRRMPDAERQAFVDQFTPTSQAMAFAVLGGALGEGIDLPGERLVGAFVVTLGLPQVNPVNDAFRQRLQQLFPGRGYDYTYLYPGMHKVVQAAGRVIRTPQDHGVVVLMDARFARREVQALLPGWWALQVAPGDPGHC